MIRRIKVSNYRSLGPDVTVEPGRLSYFVGPNGAGKSNLLDVLTFVRDAVSVGLPAAVTSRNGISTVRRHSSGHPYNVHIELHFTVEGERPCSYAFTLTGDKKEEYRVKDEKAEIADGDCKSSFWRSRGIWPEGLAPGMDEQSLALTALGGSELFKPLVDFLSRMMVYSIFPDKLSVPQKFDSTWPMRRHGENWLSILKELARNAEAKDDLVLGLKALTGDIEDVQVRSVASHLIAEFRQQPKTAKEKRWFDASQQSDGTLRVAGLLTALLQDPPLPVIGIEEPELTVHPGALPIIRDYLKQASENSQILVTTHSPVLLDLIDIDREDLFAVERPHGRTGVQRVGSSQLESVRKGLLELSDLMLSGDLQLSLFDDDGGREKS